MRTRLSSPKPIGRVFIENEAFSELRRFAKNALDWMHDQRQKETNRAEAEAKGAGH